MRAGLTVGLNVGLGVGPVPSVGGYPATADAMRAASAGLGTWSAGWLCDESSGNLAPAFGGETLTAVNTPVYGIEGPRGGADKAIGLNSSNDGFAASGPSVFDPGSGDLILAAVVRFAATPTTDSPIALAKSSFGGTEGFFTFSVNASGGARFDVRDTLADGNTRITLDTSTVMVATQWHVVMAALSRATNRMRVGFRSLATGVAGISTETNCSTIGSLANATASFRLGVSNYPVQLDVAAAYVGTGAGAADNLPANLADAIATLATRIIA